MNFTRLECTAIALQLLSTMLVLLEAVHVWEPRIAQKAVRGGGNPLWTHTLSLNDTELSSRRGIFVILEILSAEFEARLPLTIRAI